MRGPFPLASVCFFLGWLAPLAGAVPLSIHAYEFQGNLADSRSGGAQLLTEGGTLGSDLFEFDPMYPGDYNEGLTLKNVAVTDPAVYSIEMRLKFDRLRNETPPGPYGLDQSWIKTIDYTDGLYSYGLYVEDNIRWEGPGEEGLIEFIASTGTPGGFHYPGVSAPSVILADTWFHVVVTRDAAGLFTCYVDGEEVFDFSDERNDAVIDAAERTLRFMQPDQQAIDQYDVYEVTKGALDYLRVYDEVLTAGDVMALFAPGHTGDYNDDGVVDVADYLVWRNNLGMTVELPNDPAGGQIGIAQYEAWKDNYGMSVGGLETIIAVPEPAALPLALLGATFLGWLRRSSGRRRVA